MDRRDFIRSAAAISAAGAASAAAAADSGTLPPTPREIEGPFYPTIAQADRDLDLTRIEGHSERASGDVVVILGRVIDQHGEPIVGATVDLWQANAAGRYRHPHDPNTGVPLDPHFQGWAIIPSGQDGGFRVITIIPGAYPAGRNWDRPPHVHYKVSKRGYEERTTQMYFPDQPLNAKDHLLRRKSPAERAVMTASADGKTDDGEPILRYTIVLEKLT